MLIDFGCFFVSSLKLIFDKLFSEDEANDNSQLELSQEDHPQENSNPNLPQSPILVDKMDNAALGWSQVKYRFFYCYFQIRQKSGIMLI